MMNVFSELRKLVEKDYSTVFENENLPCSDDPPMRNERPKREEIKKPEIVCPIYGNEEDYPSKLELDD